MDLNGSDIFYEKLLKKWNFEFYLREANAPLICWILWSTTSSHYLPLFFQKWKHAVYFAIYYSQRYGITLKIAFVLINYLADLFLRAYFVKRAWFLEMSMNILFVHMFVCSLLLNSNFVWPHDKPKLVPLWKQQS